MKRLLAVMMLIALPARADLPVVDFGALVGQAKSLLQQAQSYSAQLRQLTQEIQTVTNTAQTVASLAHDPSLGAVMGLAGQLGLSSSMPINPWAVQSLMSGYGGMNTVSGLTGKLSGLGNMINGSYSNDRIYTCTDNSFSCVTQQQSAASYAAYKGSLGQIFQDMASHQPVLQGLRDRLATATTMKDVADAQAQISVENAWVSNQQGQLQTIISLAEAQRHIREQQQDERLTQDIDAYLRASPGG